MLQERNTSRVAFVELKVCKLNRTAQTVSIELRPDQAAWLMKWERYGGKCFLFLGMEDGGRFDFYGVFRPQEYRGWLKVPKRFVPIKEVILFSEPSKVRAWFIKYIEMDNAVVCL